MSTIPGELIARLTPAEVQQSIGARGAVVIDVRFPFDYAGGRVPGSVNYPGGSFRSRGAGIGRERVLIFVSADGEACVDAGQIALGMGFSDVAVMVGGFDAWSDAGLDCDTISDGVNPSPAGPPQTSGSPPAGRSGV